MRSARSWTQRLKAVGEAYLGVVRAELAELAADVSRSGRALVRALALLAAAAGVAFWTLGLLLYFAIEVLALWLPRWGAVGVVLALYVLLALGFGLAARRRLTALEWPATTVARRLSEHQRWWSERIAADREMPAGGDEDTSEEES